MAEQQAPADKVATDQASSAAMDPVTLAVLRGRLEQVADEMDATLYRSAFICGATRGNGDQRADHDPFFVSPHVWQPEGLRGPTGV